MSDTVNANFKEEYIFPLDGVNAVLWIASIPAFGRFRRVNRGLSNDISGCFLRPQEPGFTRQAAGHANAQPEAKDSIFAFAVGYTGR
jgi:hypothetical protein